MTNGGDTGFTTIEARAAGLLRSWWFFGLASAATVGLLVLASWPWRFNRFALAVTSRVVEISASATRVHDIGVKLPDGEDIRIFGARPDDLPPELEPLRGVVGAVRLAASSAVLQSISLPSGAGLVVRASEGGGVDIGVLKDGAIGLVFSGKIEVIDPSGVRKTVADISSHRTLWQVRPANAHATARVVMPSRVPPIALYNQPIDNFRFRPPSPAEDDPGAAESEIVSGKLELLDTGEKVELNPRELILLEGGSRFLSRMEAADGGVAVDISGVADQVSVGPARPGLPLRLDRDLTPSVLSYLVGQHQLKLLWGLGLAVLGALWKVRQWALKWDT
jgi:hypothetical protein